jgi:hypothetical protein
VLRTTAPFRIADLPAAKDLSVSPFRAPLSSDHDLIRLDHTFAIYEALPIAELAVFPNSTHLVPYDDPQMFNATVERFLNTPFKRKDRIADTMTSFKQMETGLAKSPRLDVGGAASPWRQRDAWARCLD